MEVNFTLWSLKEVLDKIPFDSPSEEGRIDMDFSKVAAPYYVKNFFKVSIEYEDNLPYEASCCAIYSPNENITVVMIMKRDYESRFVAWLNGAAAELESVCFRRELYCHETCHLVAIIRAFPSDRSSEAYKDFKEKIKNKFSRSVKTEEDFVAISIEKQDASPSYFDNDHFRYGNDSLNFFRLYAELMIPYDKMVEAAKILCEDSPNRGITFKDVAQKMLIDEQFFKLYPEKFTTLRELLLKESKTA